MRFTLFKVIAMGVMHSMTARPAVIRNQHQAMEHETHPALDLTVWVKGAVATFVRNHPAPHRHRACDDSIENPQRSSPQL
jgi:hypothetical protein